LKDDGIHGIIANSDNSMYAYAHLSGEYEDKNLNIPSLDKLTKALAMVSDEEIALKCKNNHLEYKDDKIKFKYHLHDEGLIRIPNLSLSKVRSFSFDIKFYFDLDFLSNILQKSSITNTKKLYLYTEDGYLVWKIGDDTIPNSDSICIIGDEVDFELKPFVMKIDSLKLISKISKKSNVFQINSKTRIGKISTKKDGLSIEYIFSSIVS
jgi:hypothetical protein